MVWCVVVWCDSGMVYCVMLCCVVLSSVVMSSLPPPLYSHYYYSHTPQFHHYPLPSLPLLTPPPHNHTLLPSPAPVTYLAGPNVLHTRVFITLLVTVCILVCLRRPRHQRLACVHAGQQVSQAAVTRTLHPLYRLTQTVVGCELTGRYDATP
jgi:hypothetical protein